MILQAIIQQSYNQIPVDLQPPVIWNAAKNGYYNPLSDILYTDLWNPMTEDDKTYNHHPFVEEHNGKLHFMHSTTNADEENPGMYVRYTTTDLDLTNQEPYSDLFPPQDDLTKARSLGGRVCVPSGFAKVGGDLYALTDVNDRSSGSDPRPRIGVGILARKVNNDGSFGTIYWIENVDGSLNAPNPISGYPAYTFNASLRNQIRDYFLNNPEERTDWYFSVPSSDPLYTEEDFNGKRLTEPRIVQIPDERYMKIWRLVDTVVTNKVVQFSQYGFDWGAPYDSQIPDSPSRTMVLKLSNNVVAVIGNNEGDLRDPLFLALSSDGLNYEAVNVYNIDNETSGAVYPGHGKGAGVQYPHAIQLSNEKLCVIYSVNKEDIRAAIFDKPQLT